MCGRYYIEISDKELQEICDILMEREKESREQLKIKLFGEIFPTDIVPVQTGVGQYKAMKWGFAGFAGRPIINARSETALEKPAFRSSMLERRCLIPASGYYEWKSEGNKKVKHKFYIPGEPIYFAGCYKQEKNSGPLNFVILTRPAAGKMKDIHDRMPVIIPERHVKDWLQSGADAMEQAIAELDFEAV